MVMEAEEKREVWKKENVQLLYKKENFYNNSLKVKIVYSKQNVDRVIV